MASTHHHREPAPTRSGWRSAGWAMVLWATVSACTSIPDRANPALGWPLDSQRIEPLLTVDGVLLGEQHDATDHQRIELAVVQALSQRAALAALVLEMAPHGHSTRALKNDATPAMVQTALHWEDSAWPWAAYGAAVMAAVQAGVPVIGANLRPAELRQAMHDTGLDQRVREPVWRAQQESIRLGHCNLLPESQLQPMVRVQLARDILMAQTMTAWAQPGKVVLLLAGSAHVDRAMGVPLHLPAGFRTTSVLLQANTDERPSPGDTRFHQTWPTGPGPGRDYCAEFKASRAPPAATSSP